jgi:predicted helicase
VSQLLIQQYLNNLQDLRKVSGSSRESVVREAFKDLLKGWGRSHDLIFVPEYEITTSTKDRRYVDGALVHALRMPFGYWEAKDEKDDLDAEIDFKLKRGYPQDNIIFEDSTQAVLIQNRVEVIRCQVDDVANLKRLLSLFFGYERAEIGEFRRAVEQFKTDLPAVLEALREMIEKAHQSQSGFRRAAKRFLDHAHEAINPSLTEADVREMLIQHILTEDIFSKVFGEDDFHRQNNVAKALYALEATFFTGDLKKRTLRGLDPYYAAIRAAAAQIGSHHEKQTFLKVIYENFYKVYNAKAADRLGVIYTPNDIVRFMVESADWLCEKHFSRNLIDPQVEILDPAAGTGTFICELLEHFRGQGRKLKQKYREELHANEVAILPYYVANLNIEATYAAITGEYAEFPNLCFVDTLDNVAGLRKHAGHQDELFGGVSEENVERIRRQNKRKISVIIGNPPYNANQLNENENNKNREYPDIDRRIKDTYIKASTAQKTKLYDMYTRFFRWASDRVEENGIVAFVSNSSFINARGFDGFRRVVEADFNEIWIVDLKGDARTSGERRRREGGNVFDDQIRVGIAVYFCVKRSEGGRCRIYYQAVRDAARSEEKRAFLSSRQLSGRPFTEIHPDKDHNWINLTDNDFGDLLPLVSRETKQASNPMQESAILKSYSFGVVTNRDDWVYGESKRSVAEKVKALIAIYNKDRMRLSAVRDAAKRTAALNTTIKWTRAVKRDLAAGVAYSFDAGRIIEAVYRPYCMRYLYFCPQLNEMPNLMPRYFGASGTGRNDSIVFTDPTAEKPFMAWATRICPDMHLVGAASGAVCIPRRRGVAADAEDNITDWGLRQFAQHYDGVKESRKCKVTKDAVFYYTYAVLHDPVYREKYSVNLKREFPRLPLYRDFSEWVRWGKELMNLHLDYATVEATTLKRTDRSDIGASRSGRSPAVLLKADLGSGRVMIDSETTLSGFPAEAWEYRLGHRSALEWILDQYKERKPKDPTIRERFNTYRFADHKEKVIDLLERVTTVSVRTVEIMNAMRTVQR